jgi:putative membrane protein
LPDLGSRKALIGAIVFVLLVVFLSTFGAQPSGLLFGALLAVLPLIAMYFIVRWVVSAGVRDAGTRTVEQHPSTPREILDERYARGEIGRDEYEQVRRDLETG